MVVPNPFWQKALNVYGGIVEGADDINQALNVILKCPKGCDPLRPQFGSAIWQYIDQPINIATPHIVREVWDAITLWEPRIQLTSVSCFVGSSPGQIIITLVWQWLGGLSPNQSTVVL